jgi:uncharacterized membrane protein YkvA (DUF1232 family)
MVCLRRWIRWKAGSSRPEAVAPGLEEAADERVFDELACMSWRKWWSRLNKASLWRTLAAVWYLVLDKRTPLAPKVVAWSVLAYALSPMDLVPDLIPVLGLLDDLVILPMGLWLVVKLVPPWLWHDKLLMAQALEGRLPKWLAGLVLVIVVWMALVALLAWWLWSLVWAA